MNKIFAPFLPPWAETGLQPAFYDVESGTVLQQTARMYNKVNQLTRLFNEFSEATSEEVNAFEREVNDTVAEYIEKFTELKDFVDDYFDNLDVQEEINNKLDEMVEDGTMEAIMATYAETKVDYFYIDSTTSENDILSAFASPKTKVIEFENGTYTLNSNIILSSNTTVNLNGSSLVRGGSGLMILGYATDSTYTGYNGVHNVTFNNGKIGYPMALMHNDNIKFIDIEFLPVPDHAIQIASSKDIEIKGCIFDGRTLSDDRWQVLEMLQLEAATRSGQPFLDDEDSISYDNGGNYNIVIDSCHFVRGDWSTNRNYTAIGHHSDNAENHFFNENITIKNCRFDSSYYSQLCPAGFHNCLIENNIFNQTDEDNGPYNIRFRYYNKNVIVRGNTFIGGNLNINNVNMVSYNYNLLIENNSFTSEFSGGDTNICVRNWDGVKIINNKFLKRNKHFITLRGDDSNPANPSRNVEISGNSFDNGNLTADSNLNMIYLDKSEKVTIVRNNVKMTTNRLFVYINADDSSDYSLSDNFIEYTSNYNVVSGTTGWDSKNIKDIPITCFFGDQAYSTLSQSLTYHNFTDFDTINLQFHKTNDPNTPYFASIRNLETGKLSITSAKTYYFCFEAGSQYKGALKINTDGTFEYSSSTNNLTLRGIVGLNTI